MTMTYLMRDSSLKRPSAPPARLPLTDVSRRVVPPGLIVSSTRPDHRWHLSPSPKGPSCTYFFLEDTTHHALA